MVRLTVLAVLSVFAGTIDAQSPDASAQYRVAKRLVAEGSPAAGDALERVVALEPDGPLADDALLDRAELIGLPHWPEDLTHLNLEQINSGRSLLKRIVDNFPRGDRTPVARHRLGLLMLAPFAGRDAEQARLSLLALAAANHEAASPPARYTLAWIAEQNGDLDRAEATYQRLRIEHPDTELAARACAGVGRVGLRRGETAAAAVALQQASDAGVLDPRTQTNVAALRDVAVDVLLRRFPTVEALRIDTNERPSAVAATPERGALFAQRKARSVIEVGVAGEVIDRWTVEQPVGVAVTSTGTRFAIGTESVTRLESGGRVVTMATPGELGAFSALAAADDGRIWMLGRKGDRLGALDPGTSVPRIIWRGDGVRLSGLAWDGSRLLSVDTRAGAVVTIRPDGSTRTVVDTGLERPSAIVVDPAGRIAVLEDRGSRVRVFDAAGVSLGAFESQLAGMQRATDLSLGLDGALQLIEEGSGLWWRGE